MSSVKCRSRGIEYLSKIPAKDAIPPGRVVVHNHVVPPVRRLGTRGFRAWTEPLREGLMPCECGWAPELGAHYRVRLVGEANG